MKQSRNLTRHVKELEDIYSSILLESEHVQTFEHEKNVKKDEIEGKGPDVEGVEKPVENLKESPETVKSQFRNINNSMNDSKNIFDKLYSTIMEAGDDFDVDGLDAGLDDEMGGDFGDEGGEGGEGVTITLTQDQVDVLKDVLKQLDGGEGDDIEDLDDGGDLLGGEEDEESPFPEAVEAQHTSEGQHPGQDPTQLGPGKKNVVSGTASKVTSGGASGDVTDKVGNDGNLADTTAKMTSTSSRSNVVQGKISGGNQGLLA